MYYKNISIACYKVYRVKIVKYIENAHLEKAAGWHVNSSANKKFTKLNTTA